MSTKPRLVWGLLGGFLFAACQAEPLAGLDAGAGAADTGLEPGPDAAPACPFGLTSMGGCAPEGPRGTPEADCPSGEYLADAGFSGRGLCLPARPQGTPEADCPSGRWSEAPGFEARGICLPSAPALADWACPAGWSPAPLLAGDAGVPDPPTDVPARSLCVPPTPTACPDGSRFSLVSGACVVVGSACPAGDWPQDDELRLRAPGFSGALIFVKAGAPSPGAGTRAAPYPTLADALTTATAGDVVALAKGEHAAGATILPSLALVGACAAETRLVAAASVTLSLRGTGAVLVSDVSFTGEATAVEARDREGATTLESVRVLEASGAGIRVKGGTGVTTLRGVQVQGLAQTGQTPSSAAVVVSAGQAVIADCTLEQVPGASLRVELGGRLTATDLLIRDSRARTLDGDARGLFVGDTSEATLARAVFAQGVGQGVQVAQGSTLTASDTWISGIRSRPDGQLGNGLEVDAAGVAVLERVAIVDTQEAALVGFDPKTRITLTDGLLRDTRASGEGSYGMGVWLEDGASLEATRLVIDRPTMAGLGLNGAQASLTDLVVRDCRPTSSALAGRGLSAEGGSKVKVLRGSISAVSDVAVLAHAAPTTLDLTDLAIREVTKIRSAGQLGVGLVASQGAVVTGVRLLIERATTSGVRADGDQAAVVLQDLVVRQTRPDATGSFGRGLDAAFGASLQVNRGLLASTRDVAAAADGPGTTLVITDLVIVDTGAQLKSGSNGEGVFVQNSATGFLTRVLVSRAVRGADARGAAALTLRDVRLADLASDAVFVGDQSTLDAARLVTERVGAAGLLVLDSTLKARDLVVRDVVSDPARTNGRGLQLTGATTIERALVERARDIGLLASGRAARVTLSDVVVRDLASEEASGSGGYGLVSQLQASVTATRILIQRARHVGLLALGGGVEAQSVALVDSQDASCGEECWGGGTGAAVFHAGGSLRLTDFVIESSRFVGLQLGAGASLQANQGLLAHNLVALNVLEPSFDFEAALVAVKVFENGTDLASEVVPVPTVGPLQPKPDPEK